MLRIQLLNTQPRNIFKTIKLLNNGTKKFDNKIGLCNSTGNGDKLPEMEE